MKLVFDLFNVVKFEVVKVVTMNIGDHDLRKYHTEYTFDHIAI